MSASESRSVLVMELAEEFLERYRQGERPSLKEYIDRHPELAAEIKEVFPAMALMENVALADDSLVGEDTSGRGDHLPESPPPAQLGDYRILREVGRGGMGIVYEAEQVSLGRHVALKVLPRKVLLDAAQKRRFEREAKAAAKLHHTNIVPVFGVGEHEGLPYYVMQFIQGLGLDDVLRELKRLHGGTPTPTGGELRVSGKDVSAADVARSLMTRAFQDGERGGVSALSEHALGALTPPRSPESGSTDKLSDSFTLSASSVKLPGSGGTVQGKGQKASYWQSVARIGVQVADALDYAHKQGIQHRDIKPSNLLLDMQGRVWVTDFGLARTDNEDHLTQTGDIVGTLRYLPPEALEGRSDKRSDIYSLGLTLYELLALKPAFGEYDRHRLIKLLTTEEPPRLDKLRRAIPRDLVTIVHKAIDREPGRRYQTAAELAADVQRFLDDEPIQARRISSVERVLRWGRRNKGLAVLSAVTLLLLATVAVVSTTSALRLLAEQKRANQAERSTLASNVKSLLTASSDSVPFLVDTFKPRAQEVLPALEEREREMENEFVPRLRVHVALAVLGRDRCRELCAAAADTPPAESFNFLLGLKSGDREAAVRELSSRYSQAKDGEGRTRLAIALLELGDPRVAQAELALKPNLTARVRFIHRFAAWHGDLTAVAELLRAVEDAAFRSGLCLAVASVDPARLSPSTRRAVDEVLTDLYTSAPDGGTHGAAEYALRHRGLPLPAIAPAHGPIAGRGWFVNRQGMTLIAVEPGWFHPQDFDRPPGPDGLPAQTVVLTRPFCMGDQEVTAEWYRRFLNSNDHPRGEELTPEARQADLRQGLAIVNRHNAVLFCNWLSRAEGRTPCYRSAGPERGMMCDFTANGYRLPTDAEWEHAFRCGTTTRFFVGEDVGRMLEYGRVFAIGPGHGKCFFPNPRGLFDMLGNAWEICWDQGINQYADGLSIDPVGPVGPRFAMRGGAAEAGLFYLHGSARPVNNADATQAFRVVCGPLTAEEAKNDNALTLSTLERFHKQYPQLVSPSWLALARVFAELGQHDKADASFAKAAALTPKELDRFVQAGWWVIGPYPEDLKLPCPPENDPDPSHPAAVGSAEPLRWRPAPTERDGRVDLRAIFNADHISAYALTYVHSPEERTATLLVGGDDRVRVWLNGGLVHQTKRAFWGSWDDLHRVPVTLNAGRNTLLCKISQDWGPHLLYLRIADNPFDRAILHAQLGLWEEAAALYARGIDRRAPADPSLYVRCIHAQLLVGDTAGYRRYLARMLERFPPNNFADNWSVYAGGLLDGAVETKRLVELAEHALALDKSPWIFHAAGIADYRAGQFDKAIGRLEESLKNPGWKQYGGHASELGLALAYHRLGHAQQGRQWLDKAEEWYEKAVQDALASATATATLYHWPDWPSFVILRREAHKVIRGKDLPDDPRLKQLADRTRDWLHKRDKATADYDVALFLEPHEPRLWLTRARRLAELKRTKEAEADFAKAVELKPDDPEVFKARGQIYAEIGQKDKAAADFRKAQTLIEGKKAEPKR
jgi:serine/threonine protein kinase/formylglycine-generating enzyme required for sulfatase activity/tetratricopeptide (TPR) repeat protein